MEGSKSLFQFADALKLWLSRHRGIDLSLIAEAELRFDPGHPDYSSWTPGEPLSCDVRWRGTDGEQRFIEIAADDMGLFITDIAACAWESRDA